MRYILVRGAKPTADARCCRCQEMIENRYLRDIRTKRTYCGLGCYSSSAVGLLSLFVKERARRVRFGSVKSSTRPKQASGSDSISANPIHMVPCADQAGREV